MFEHFNALLCCVSIKSLLLTCFYIKQYFSVSLLIIKILHMVQSALSLCLCINLCGGQ